jgi:hypothetical protein
MYGYKLLKIVKNIYKMMIILGQIAAYVVLFHNT